MKTFVVPTDFSENAANALEYAIQLANQFDATIYLISAYKVRSRAGMLVNIEDIQRRDAESDLTKVRDQHKSGLLNPENLKITALRGETVDSIVRFARGVKAHLIVMGTQGASGLKGVFLGSKTTGVMDRCDDIPILAIPNGYRFQPIKEIVFALDGKNISSYELVEPMVQVAKKNKARVQVFHVENQLVEVGVDPAVEIYLNDVEHEYNQFFDIDNINKAINGFIDRTNGDLLCMIKRKRGFLDSLFHISVTEKEAFDSPVPLLVMHDKSNKK